MFILDTNVLSELIKPEPAIAVQNWLVRRVVEGLRTTAICQAEIMVGIALLPDGRRRRSLETAALHMFSQAFDAKILAFDPGSVSHFAEIVATRSRRGRRIEFPDAMIAAIARSHGAAIVTRNVNDFEDCGIEVLDPWSEVSPASGGA